VTVGTNQSAQTDVRIGTVVDKYTIERLLGQGGMGAVYLARHAQLQRRCAIKFLLPELAKNRDFLKRFENEAKAAGGLEHGNLVAVIDFGRASDGAPYLVMEFLEGEDCSKLIRRLGALPVGRAVDIVLQACRGMAVAHRNGIIHRDLKPENLLVSEAGDKSDLVKVLDFGIAKLRPSETTLATGPGAIGTAHYMSPEQARGSEDVDHRTDVWSLGVVLYELLSGRKPFEGQQFLHVVHQILSADPPPLATLRAGLPPGLVAVVARAMERDLAQRWPTVVALEEALGRFAGRATTEPFGPAPSPVVTVPTPATAPVATAGTTRQSAPGKAIAVAVIVGASIVVAVLVLRSRPPAAPTVETRSSPASAAAAPRPSSAAKTPELPGVPSSVVRTMSEHSEPASNKLETPTRGARRVRNAELAVPKALLEPGQPPAGSNNPAPPSPTGNAIEIDTSNPY
jgi:serine/threonine protein kinase